MLSADLYRRIAQYILGRPYIEVAQLVSEMAMAEQAQQKASQKAAEAPESKDAGE